MIARREHLPSIALSVRQPWAWAIVHAGKDVENRCAAAVRHGLRPAEILIHASKGMTRAEYESAAGFIASLGMACPWPDDLVRGAVIGGVTVTAIAAEHDSPWFFGPRALVLADPYPLTPLPGPGALGYFRWRVAGAIETPKPWMTKYGWRAAALPLFAEEAGNE